VGHLANVLPLAIGNTDPEKLQDTEYTQYAFREIVQAIRALQQVNEIEAGADGADGADAGVANTYVGGIVCYWNLSPGNQIVINENMVLQSPNPVLPISGDYKVNCRVDFSGWMYAYGGFTVTRNWRVRCNLSMIKTGGGFVSKIDATGERFDVGVVASQGRFTPDFESGYLSQCRDSIRDYSDPDPVLFRSLEMVGGVSPLNFSVSSDFSDPAVPIINLTCLVGRDGDSQGINVSMSTETTISEI
jgi:hypothetical protein